MSAKKKNKKEKESMKHVEWFVILGRITRDDLMAKSETLRGRETWKDWGRIPRRGKKQVSAFSNVPLTLLV